MLNPWKVEWPDNLPQDKEGEGSMPREEKNLALVPEPFLDCQGQACVGACVHMISATCMSPFPGPMCPYNVVDFVQGSQTGASWSLGAPN